jgi:hypothetical protein
MCYMGNTSRVGYVGGITLCLPQKGSGPDGSRPIAPFYYLPMFAPVLLYESFLPGPDEHPGQYSCIVDTTSTAIKQNSLYSPDCVGCRQAGCFGLTFCETPGVED